MKIEIPSIRKQISRSDILKVLENKYSTIGPIWVNQQMQWTNNIYQSFKDHNKFLIILYLIKKTLDFYSKNFIKLTFDEFYLNETVEIENFSVVEVSNALGIPKESTRRKIVELEKMGVIKRNDKKIIIDRSVYPFVKPIKSIERMAHFLSMLSKILVEEKILLEKFESEDVEKILKNNFSHVWKLYYELQIPRLLRWKKFFKDLETWHIWALCGVGKYIDSDSNDFFNDKNFDIITKKIFFSNVKKNNGINAMSISDISGIPRATVVRKLNRLIKENYLKIDNKKHYTITGVHAIKLIPIHKTVISNLATLSSFIYNLIIVKKTKDNTKTIDRKKTKIFFKPESI